MNDHLSWQRLAWLLRSDLLRSYRSVLVISGTVALVALVVSLIDARDGDPGLNLYRAGFIAALFTWGTIATSLCFADLHGRGGNTAFLLLPASALEKTAARLLVYTVGLIVYLLLFTTVLSWVLEAINAGVFDVRRELFSPFDRFAWSLLPHFVVTQALFFLGAVWFRKANFVKTVGVVTAIVVGFCALAVGLAWALAPNPRMFAGPDAFGSFEWWADAATAAYFYALPLFCWFVTWLRVTETQVSHGI